MESSRGRQWCLGRMGVEEEEATAPHPVRPIYRGRCAYRIFRFKFEPDIPVNRIFRVTSEPDIPISCYPEAPSISKETCVQERIWLLDGKA